MDREAFLKSVDPGRASNPRNAGLPLGRAATATESQSPASSADLVERALAILDECTGPNGPGQAPLGLEVAPRPVPNFEAPRPAAPGSLVPKPDLELQRRVLSDGTECPLPIRYFDVQCLIATYLTGPDRAAELLGGSGLQAVLQEDGKAVVQLYCIEYRKTDIGPYNEVGLTVLAQGGSRAGQLCGRPSCDDGRSEPGRPGNLGLQQVRRIDQGGEARQGVLDGPQRRPERTDRHVRGHTRPIGPGSAGRHLDLHDPSGRLVKTVIRVLTPFQASRGDGYSCSRSERRAIR